MRIAFCSDALPPIIDGVTRTLSELAATLLDASVDFLFVSAVKPDATPPWRDRVHTVAGVPIPLYPDYRLGLPRTETLDPVLDRFAPDVVHVVTPSLLGLYGTRYARRRGIPVVASFHTNFVSLLPHYWLGTLEELCHGLARRFYNQCSLTLAPSRSTALELRAHGIHNVALWQRGVNPLRFSPSFRSEGLRARIGANGTPVLLYVGRLGREKNLRYLVRAIQLLAQRGSQFKLVIVGEGPMRAELAASLPHAHFAGCVQGAELSRWYASADLFVFPSQLETFGNVVLEAFASGLPVVGVDAGGVRELVMAGVNGLLASPSSPAAFADAVHSLMEEPQLAARMGIDAQFTATQYRWPEVGRQLLEHYERLLGNGVRPQTALAAAG
jgi:phosphatidylinositol alpha 1,6-mannosyltransferase